MSLAKTYFQDILISYPSMLDRDEIRRTSLGLMTAALEMTDEPGSVVSRQLKQEALTSQGRNLDVPVLKKGNVTISNVRSCTIGDGTRTESDLVRVIWKTVSADVLMVPSEYEKNFVSYTEDFAFKITNAVEAFGIEIETDLEAAFDTNKSQVYNSGIVGTKYTLTGSAIRVTPANVDFFFNDIDPINFADDFNQVVTRVISNHTVMPTVQKYVNQGGSNSQNTAFQFMNKRFDYSNRITNGVGVLATGYFMPMGSVGLLTRVDVDARMNHKSTKGTEWFEQNLPGLPFPVGVMFNSECADKSAMEVAGLSHLKSTLVEHYQISFDYAIVVPYNSDIATKPSSIRKFEFMP